MAGNIYRSGRVIILPPIGRNGRGRGMFAGYLVIVEFGMRLQRIRNG